MTAGCGRLFRNATLLTIFVSVKTIYLAERLERMPILKLLAPFAAGILLSEHYALPLWFLAGAFALCGTLAILLRSGAAVLLLAATTGFAAGQLRTRERTVPLGTNCIWEIEVDALPTRRGRFTAAEGVVRAWRDPVRGRWHASGDRILLRADTLTPLTGGERIRCHGTLRPLRGPEGYLRLMDRRGYAGTLRLSERLILERLPEKRSSLHLRAAEKLSATGLHGEAGAVVRAMTVADRSGITPELRASYARSGLAHLLAVSGLHTGIVFLLVNLLLRPLTLLRRGHVLRNLAAAAAVWLYVAATGFPPSAVRAAVMCTLLQAALASASEYTALNALAAAAFGMLLWNPAWIGDISFRLSFLAVGAILAWGVPLCRRLHTRFRLLNALTDTLAIGLCASLATAPLVCNTFGILPVAGLLLNPLVIPLAGTVVLCGTLLLALPASGLAGPVRLVAEGAARVLDTLADAAAALPGGFAEYTLPALPAAIVYLVFLLLTAAAWCAEPEKRLPLLP